jgi:hypothetical protein
MRDFDCVHCEPPLSQMLGDPMMQALMESDGVDAGALNELLSAARRRIAEADRPSSARGKR